MRERPFYIFVDRQIKAVEYEEWDAWLRHEWKTGQKDMCISRTQVNGRDVYTRFLGMDLRGPDASEPIFFETMVLPRCVYSKRCSTYEQSLEQHKRVVELVESGADI